MATLIQADIKDRLFTIHSDFQVSELTSENAAVGCGEDFALGSMYASKHLSPDIKPRELITTALKAATEYSSYVRPPYIILST